MWDEKAAKGDPMRTAKYGLMRSVERLEDELKRHESDVEELKAEARNLRAEAETKMKEAENIEKNEIKTVEDRLTRMRSALETVAE